MYPASTRVHIRICRFWTWIWMCTQSLWHALWRSVATVVALKYNENVPATVSPLARTPGRVGCARAQYRQYL